MTKGPRRRRPPTAARASELAEDTARYDREMVIDEFGPMTAAARARWARAKRKPGRPRRGKGAKAISVSVERGLLSRSDALAKDLGLSRAGLIERGLQAVLATEGRKLSRSSSRTDAETEVRARAPSRPA
jgi:hypothetical protein